MKTRRLMMLVLLPLAIACSCVSDKIPEGEFVTTGMPAPPFSVRGAGGAEFVSPDDFAGRTTLLVFFATWCPQCGKELPAVNEVWERLHDQAEYQVIAISRGGEGKYEQSESTIAGYWHDAGYGMPWFRDPDRSVFDSFAQATIPRIYIIDRTGTVVWYAASPEYDAEQYIDLLTRFASDF